MILDLFTKLVSIDSPSGREFEVGRYVKKHLEDSGLTCITDKEGNIFSFATGKGKPILLSAHLDTVQGNTSIRSTKAKGIIKSSGNTILGADNKAAVAAILTALKRTPAKRRRNLEIVFSVQEETDGGVSKINLSMLKSKEGISADSGKPIGTIISDTPYIDGFEIRVVGKSSHSSEPEKGINALSIASDAISKFKWGRIDEFSTANIGLIEGGSAINTTPGRMLLVGELRSYLKENLAKIKCDLERIFETSARIYDRKVSVDFKYYCDGYSHTDRTLLGSINKIYKKLNIKKEYMKDFGGSDANFFNSKGIRVVDIGDGVYSPHTNEESISIKDLDRLTDIFSNYILA